jgi:hypothetical protein
MKLSKTYNLSTTHPELLDEWDYTSNNIRPEDVTYSSKLKVGWICSIGHRYIAQIGHRAISKSGCSICNGKVVGEDNNLTVKFPRLLKEWNYELNDLYGLDPYKVMPGSHAKAAWICQICQYKWETVIKTRTLQNHGCPKCAGQVVTSDYNLAIMYPHLLEEWDWEENNKLGLDPLQILPKAHIYVF